MKQEIKLTKREPTWNYILNDLALYSLITKVIHSGIATYQDKFDLMYQIELLQKQNTELKEENKKIKETIQEYNDAGEYIYKLEEENQQLKERINKLGKENSVLMENLIRSKTKYNNDKARYRRKAKMYRERINNAIEDIEDKLKIYPEGLVGKHLGQEFLKDILDLLKGDKE